MSDKNPSRRPGTLAVPAFLSTIFLVELIIDLLPPDWLFDWILIPAELVLDALILLVVFLGSRLERPHGRSLRSRRALSSVSIAVLAYWAFFTAVLGIEFWYNSADPILGFFALFLEVPFDFFLFVIGVVLTIVAIRSGGPLRRQGRQLSSGQR